MTELKINQGFIGQNPPQQKPKYRNLTAKLEAIVQEYGIRALQMVDGDRRDFSGYLRAIAFNLSLG